MIKKIIFFSLIIFSLTPSVFAQDTFTEDLPINSKPSDWIIVIIGVLGGLTTAGLGIAKNHNKIQENKKILKEILHTGDSEVNNKVKDSLNGVLPTKLTFDPSKFSRTLLVSTITSILLAAGASVVFSELNPITLIMIYAASIGMSSISKPGHR
ncbi:hypothetical protein [Nitrosopumilus adriaticus]|uniref:hypothetical protein n=1 Tax=Nitrosopumilus adriaticus TaxID=1580092 RepID=UPI00352EFE28